MTWNGYELTQADVDEAASVNLGAGHIIFWAKAETLPKEIVLGAPDREDTTINVVFEETE